MRMSVSYAWRGAELSLRLSIGSLVWSPEPEQAARFPLFKISNLLVRKGV